MMKNEESKLQAVALAYKKGQEKDPYVIAKGQGHIAEQIIKKATHEGIPMQKDENLIHLLSKLEINETIPETLYQAVAEVFTMLYKLDQVHGEEY